MKILKERIELSIEKQFPFVIYRKPNEVSVKAIFQTDSNTYYSKDYSENGFVFAPFNTNEKALFIPFSNAQKETFGIENSQQLSSLETEFVTSDKGKKNHISLVEQGIDYIKNSSVDKIVLSRKEVLDLKEVNLLETFQKLLAYYQSANVYFWYHPVSGMWMGATPETLLSVQNSQFSIMSLASTQEFKGTLDVNWSEKEIEEHQIVTDYIVSKVGKVNLQVSKPYTVKAGNLVHLRADIFGEVSSANFDLKKLIDVLHPTPAICGMPKDEAKEFILKNENYHREYYTGFLGEIDENCIDLFVNLRCMKLEPQNKKTSLYIGGGITKDSNSISEWEETVAKSKVMKKVL